MPDDGPAPKVAALRVLIVDDVEPRSAALQRSLRLAAIEPATSTTLDAALERLRTELFDLVVCDLRTSGEVGASLVEWVGRCAPSMKVLAIGDAVDEAFRERFGGLSIVRILETPDDHNAVVEVLRALGPRRGFFGNSIEVELFDYVQMIALTGRDKLVEVETPRGLGRIWFEHGDIVHAVFHQFRGELAFYKMLAAGRGTFREALFSEPPKRTVVRSSTHLLMEAARQTDEGTLGQTGTVDEDEETSFGDLMEEDAGQDAETVYGDGADGEEDPPTERMIRPSAATTTGPQAPVLNDAEASGAMLASVARGESRDQDFAALVTDAIEMDPVPAAEELGPADSMIAAPRPRPEDSQAQMGGGHAVFDDPETRAAMLDQFWQFEGINGVAIISSTGKVLAEDMRSNSSLVTLAGFYMRGAARIARTLGYNVFDGVVARSVNGQQMVMVSMGAASAVLSVESGADPEAVRDAVMGVD
ncbi:MAG: DUF4388 domain-containing protein [Myxococcota bacterium]